MNVYDAHSQHLLDTLEQLFNFKSYEFKPAILEKIGFDEPAFLGWHLHGLMLYLKPEYRGKRRGVRTLKLLKQFAHRSGLLFPARAFPEEPEDVQAGRKPSTEAIQRLAKRRWACTQWGGGIAAGWLPTGRSEGGKVNRSPPTLAGDGPDHHADTV
jgi:GNAT superfamily N-acetyltransferase